MKYCTMITLLTILFSLSNCSKMPPTDACGNKILTTIEDFSVSLHASSSIFYRAKFAIDADGSPRAYGPADSGLDLNQHAVTNGEWVGVVVGSDGKPIEQKATDPHPGLWVSQTSLYDDKFANTDPRRYVDSEKIPYIALPQTAMALAGIELGDIAYVFNPETKKSSFAIFADVGPEGLLGEGSIYLAKTLGIANISPRDGGLSGASIQYIVFPRSGKGNGKHLTISEIDALGKALMKNLGGEAAVLKCF